jgi:Protein of unknown function (DUF2569)
MPLATVFYLISGYGQFSSFFSSYRSLRQYFIVQSVLGIGVTLYGIYAGIALWRVSRNAANIAFTFLWVYLGCNVLMLLLPLLFGLSVRGSVREKLVFAILSYTVGYLYLLCSKRVKATYF